ncbi:MAG TPA: MFS transporter, partial [Sphingomonas sp.]|nr:MFS transporter [Sphingomonas sp.]
MDHPIGWRRSAIVALAFAAIMLSYMDRQIIALLKPTLEQQFGWTDGDYSAMASTFQFAAAVSFLGAGWFVDRIGLRVGFAIGVGVWSIAGMAHAFVSSVGGFIGARAILGASESVGTPAQVKTAAIYFPPEQRSLMIGIGNMASNLGAIVTPLLIPPLALWLGWRVAFLLTGGLGLLWVVLWLLLPPPAGTAHEAQRAARVPWRKMLSDRRQWALIAAKIFSDEVWWFLLFFAPDLFHRRFGLSQAEIGLPVALIYTAAAIGSLSGGILPSYLIGRGMSINRARKGSMLLYALLITPVPLLVLSGSVWTAVALLGLALFAHQGFSTNVFGIATDMMPTTHLGTAISIAAFFGNLSGMAMIELAGWSLDTGYGYPPLLLICGFS